MSAPALLCDTGALLDYAVQTAPDHRAFRRAIDAAKTRFVPALVLVEVDYFLREHRAAMNVIVRDLERGAFTLVPADRDLVSRAMAIDRSNPELELGLVDASIAAVAEELRVYRLATRDVRDFAALRLRDGKRFELVVTPTVRH